MLSALLCGRGWERIHLSIIVRTKRANMQVKLSTRARLMARARTTNSHNIPCKDTTLASVSTGSLLRPALRCRHEACLRLLYCVPADSTFPGKVRERPLALSQTQPLVLCPPWTSYFLSKTICSSGKRGPSALVWLGDDPVNSPELGQTLRPNYSKGCASKGSG